MAKNVSDPTNNPCCHQPVIENTCKIAKIQIRWRHMESQWLVAGYIQFACISAGSFNLVNLLLFRQ